MIADWTVPFTLTSALYSVTPLQINQEIPDFGFFFLRQDGCQLRNNVRFQKNDMPQADGAILHRRFTGGMEMDLVFQLWQTTEAIACDDVQQAMLDMLMGYLYNLINAGDNQGRISWTPQGQNPRMLDDIRLMSYPAVSTLPGALGIEIAVTVDCALPYEEDLTPAGIGANPLSASAAFVNAGNRPTYPVLKIFSDFFTLTNTTTGAQLVYDGTLPGAAPLAGGYIEFNMFRNTAYLNGNQDNMKPGIVVQSSDFFVLNPGSNTITYTGGTDGSTIEYNSAWA